MRNKPCLLVLCALLVACAGCSRQSNQRVVVYCAHDSIYAESILREFERATGIPVAVKFDTEATKSLGLVELLLREKRTPRCDVFWNNELLGTLQLHEAGALEPYKGPGYARIPAEHKDPAGYWTGFAARMRVWIVNTNQPARTPEEVDASRVTRAKPLYGTTRTHYTVLWKLWGPEQLKAWHADWLKRGLREAAGNAAAKTLVAEGVCDLGWTDTDDYFVAVDEKKPVAMVPARLPDGRVICIPNTVALIHGGPNRLQAEKLVDYLLSEQTELALARAKSRQIPLGPVDEAALPEDVRQLKRWAANSYPLHELGAAREDCLHWLKSEYAP